MIDQFMPKWYFELLIAVIYILVDKFMSLINWNLKSCQFVLGLDIFYQVILLVPDDQQTRGIYQFIEMAEYQLFYIFLLCVDKRSTYD